MASSTQLFAGAKFFIQQDTGPEFIQYLCRCIATHGGTVVSTVPLRGFVLIDPSTDKGQRLRQKWASPNKPDRHILCYTYIRACIVSNRMLPPQEMDGVTALFLHEDTAVKFYLQPILDKETIKELSISIEKAGGITDTTEQYARVIIAPNKTKKETALFKELQRKYEHAHDVFVESPEWVRTCLEKQEYEHSVRVPRNMGGMKPGGKRIAFTEDDDKNLVMFIAKRIPDPDAGGRLGNNLYTDLMARPDEYPWATRHSWHSWRNRYKTRQLIFDLQIKAWLDKNPEFKPDGPEAVVKQGTLDAKRRPGHGRTEGDVPKRVDVAKTIERRNKRAAHNEDDGAGRPVPKRQKTTASTSKQTTFEQPQTRRTRIVMTDSEEEDDDDEAEEQSDERINSGNTPEASSSTIEEPRAIRHVPRSPIPDVPHPLPPLSPDESLVPPMSLPSFKKKVAPSTISAPDNSQASSSSSSSSSSLPSQQSSLYPTPASSAFSPTPPASHNRSPTPPDFPVPSQRHRIASLLNPIEPSTSSRPSSRNSNSDQSPAVPDTRTPSLKPPEHIEREGNDHGFEDGGGPGGLSGKVMLGVVVPPTS